MSLRDFEALSPDELEAVVKSYQQGEEQRLHDEWSRVRTLATIVVQPHLSKPVKAEELLPFPWEQEAKQKARKERNPEADKARFIELVNRFKEDGK